MSRVQLSGRVCACCGMGEWQNGRDAEVLLVGSYYVKSWPADVVLCFFCGTTSECEPGQQHHVDDVDGCGMCSLLWAWAFQRWTQVASRRHVVNGNAMEGLL